MATNRRRTALLLATACLGLAACNGNAAPEPTPTSTCLTPSCDEPPTPSPMPTPTPTTAATAPPTSAEWDPPDPITPEYAERVLNELFRLEAIVVQEELDLIAEGQRMGEQEMVRRFRDTRSAFEAAAAAVIAQYDTDVVTESLEDPIGPQEVAVSAVTESSQVCMVVLGETDFSAFNGLETLNDDEFRLTTTSRNPVGWRIAGRHGAGSIPEYSCE